MAGGGKTTFTLIAETADAQKQLADFLNKTENINTKVSQGFDKSGKAASDFSMKMVTGIVGGLGAYDMLRKGLDTLTASYRMLNEERQRGSQALQTEYDPIARLSQLAGDDPKKFQRMYSDVQATMRETGVDVNRAVNLQESLENAGLQGMRQGMAPLIRSVPDTGKLVEAITGISRGFAEGGVALDPRRTQNMVMQAGQMSPAMLAQFGPSGSKIGGVSAEIGSTPAEMLAVLGEIAPQAGGIEEASTQMKQFSVKMMRMGIKKGYLGGVEEIEKMGLSDQELAKRLEGTGMLAYFNIKNARGKILPYQQKVQAAYDAPEGQDYGTGVIGARESVPQLKAVEDFQKARVAREQAEKEKYGIHQTMQEMTAENIRTEMMPSSFVARGFSKAGRGFGAMLENLQFDLDPENAAPPGTMIRQFGAGENVGLFEDIKHLLREISGNTNRAAISHAVEN